MSKRGRAASRQKYLPSYLAMLRGGGMVANTPDLTPQPTNRKERRVLAKVRR